MSWKLEDIRNAVLWLMGLIITALLTMSTFFLKSLHNDIKVMSQNVNSIVVQQGIFDARLAAIERTLVLHSEQIKDHDSRFTAYDKGIQEFFQEYDLKKRK